VSRAALALWLAAGCGGPPVVGFTDWAIAGVGGYGHPAATGSDGTLAMLAADGTDSILVFDPEDGSMVRIDPGNEPGPACFAVGADRTVLIVDRGSPMRVRTFSATGDPLWSREVAISRDPIDVRCVADLSRSFYLTVTTDGTATVDLGTGPLEGDRFIARLAADGQTAAADLLGIEPEVVLTVADGIVLAAPQVDAEGSPTILVVDYDPLLGRRWGVSLDGDSVALGYQIAGGVVIAAMPTYTVRLDQAGQEVGRGGAGTSGVGPERIVLQDGGILWIGQESLTDRDVPMPSLQWIGADGSLVARELFPDARVDVALVGVPGSDDYFLLGEAVGSLDLHDDELDADSAPFLFVVRRRL